MILYVFNYSYERENKQLHQVVKQLRQAMQSKGDHNGHHHQDINVAGIREEYNNKVKELRKSHEEEIKRANQKWNDELSLKNNEIKELNTVVEKLKNQQTQGSSQVRIDSNNHEQDLISTLRSSLKKCDEENEGLKANLTIVEKEKTSLLSDIAQLKNEIKKLTSQFAHIETSSNDSQKIITELKSNNQK